MSKSVGVDCALAPFEEKVMETAVIGSRPRAKPEAAGRLGRLAAALLAAFLGAFFIWGVGFSPIDFVHNAAHDTRHSTGFPCH
jgi:cobalt transporter subunit CbtB